MDKCKLSELGMASSPKKQHSAQCSPHTCFLGELFGHFLHALHDRLLVLLGGQHAARGGHVGLEHVQPPLRRRAKLVRVAQRVGGGLEQRRLGAVDLRWAPAERWSDERK